MVHNIAHRDASAYEPENTLRAFERAIEMGATMLELDVWLSHDEQLVVIHDEDLFRLTRDPRRVRHLTLKEIKTFDVGQGERVPSLSEVIELARGRVGLYIEMKGQHTPAPIVKALRKQNYARQAIVGSFFPWLSQRIKFLESTVRASILIGQEYRHADFVEWALAVEADYVHPCWENASPTPHKLLTAEMIADIRRRGLGIIVWHEERPAELRELVQLDVDGICTDAPDLLAKVLASREQQA